MNYASPDAQAQLDRLVIEELVSEADVAPRCEFRELSTEAECGATPATWLAILSCGHEYAYCEPHHESVRRRFADGTLDACYGSLPPKHPMMRVSIEWRRIPTGGVS